MGTPSALWTGLATAQVKAAELQASTNKRVAKIQALAELQAKSYAHPSGKQFSNLDSKGKPLTYKERRKLNSNSDKQ